MTISKKLIASTIVIGGLTVAYIAFRHSTVQPPQPTGISTGFVTAPDPSDINKTELFNLTNREREAVGLKALVANSALAQAATDKCNDMVAKNYWAHNAPDGTEPWSFIKKYLSSYKMAGENLNEGSRSASDTVDHWMHSPDHKANILEPDYTDVGFGVCEGTNYIGEGDRLIVVQHFADL